MQISLNADGFLLLPDSDGDYIERRADFKRDAGALELQLPALPAGMVGFSYDTETHIMVFYDAKQNAFPLPGEFEWHGGHLIAEKVDDFRATRDRRKAAARTASGEQTQDEVNAARAAEAEADAAYMAQVKADADAANAQIAAEAAAAEAALVAEHEATRANPPPQPPPPPPPPGV